jgi:hypothetical protein
MRKFFVISLIIGMFFSPTSVSAKKPLNLRCPQMEGITRIIADSDKMILQVDYIMWRESRCKSKNINRKDPNGGSVGLFQINKFWCKPNRYTKQGFLQDAGVLSKCHQLYNPVVSAKAFMAIYDYAHNRYGDGFGPWGGEPTWI